MALDLEKLREAHANLSKQGSGGGNEGKYVITKEGNNFVRILPPKNEEDMFYTETRIHRVTDADGNKKNYHCRDVFDEECPICKAYFALYKKHNALFDSKEEAKKGDSPFKEAAKSIRASKKFYMNVMDRDDENKVKVLSVGVKIMNKILDDILGDFGDITHLKDGRDFKINKDSVGKQWPSYEKSGTRPQPTPAGSDQEIAAAMDSLHDLKELVRLESYEDGEKIAEVYCPKEVEPSETPESDTSDEAFEESTLAG